MYIKESQPRTVCRRCLDHSKHSFSLSFSFPTEYQRITTKMSQKLFADSDLHAEALRRLCFVCGDLISKGKFYDVELYKAMLCKGLKCSTISSKPGISPSSFCAKCYSTVQGSATGRVIRTGRTLIEWAQCRPDCLTCGRLGGRGRKKKKVSEFFNDSEIRGYQGLMYVFLFRKIFVFAINSSFRVNI